MSTMMSSEQPKHYPVWTVSILRERQLFVALFYVITVVCLCIVKQSFDLPGSDVQLKTQQALVDFELGLLRYDVSSINQQQNMGSLEQIAGAHISPVRFGAGHLVEVTASASPRPQKLFNDSCPQDLLGLPLQVSGQCPDRSQPCGSLTCRNLLGGDFNHSIFDDANEFMNTHAFTQISDIAVAVLASDCASFWRQRGYIGLLNSVNLSNIEQEAVNFPIAFNLIVHRDAGQVERLLRVLYRPQNQYCIHVDENSNARFRAAIRAIAACFTNVFVSSRTERVAWSGYSRLQAEINCMKDQVAGPVRWRYLINSAGQAFPLKTIGEMVRILRIYNGANDIEGIYGKRVKRERFENKWIEIPSRRSILLTGRGNVKPPHDIDIVRGSAYGIFSRAFVEWTLGNVMARDLLEWSKTTWSPDEFYWATLHHTYNNPHLHSPGSFSGYPSSKPWLAVYANWATEKCYGPWSGGMCIFGVGDLHLLLPRKEFFVNKFHPDVQPLALVCLDAWIRHKEICPVQLDYEYYRQLPFIRR